ncbi:MAG: hypothetical protein ACXWDO_02330 [Bacteroidia bacterium]
MNIKPVIFILLLLSACQKNEEGFVVRELREVHVLKIPQEDNHSQPWDDDGTNADVYMYFTAKSDSGNSWHTAGLYPDFAGNASQKYYSRINLTYEQWIFRIYDNDSHHFDKDILMKEFILNPCEDKESPVIIEQDGYKIELHNEDKWYL